MEDGHARARRVRRWVREAPLELHRQDEALAEAAGRLGLDRGTPATGDGTTAILPPERAALPPLGALRG